MSPDQNRVRVWVFLHSLFQALPEVLLVCRILNDWYPQFVVVPQVALLASSFWYALDLFNLLNLKTSVLAKIALDK